MVAAQSRGVEFAPDGPKKGEWFPVGCENSGSEKVWADMESSLGFKPVEPPYDYELYYGHTLSKEGEAFRQRFVDYTPPEEA